jgi:uncharacterized membrane protein YgcG
MHGRAATARTGARGGARASLVQSPTTMLPVRRPPSTTTTTTTTAAAATTRSISSAWRLRAYEREPSYRGGPPAGNGTTPTGAGPPTQTYDPRAYGAAAPPQGPAAGRAPTAPVFAPPPTQPAGGGGNGNNGNNNNDPNNSNNNNAPLSSYARALVAAAFVTGLGAGVYFDAEVNLSPNQVASTEIIDRRTPNSEVCMAYGYSAMVFDQRVFVTYNPFNLYVSQPEVKPGCVLRRSNFGVLEREGLVSDKEAQACKRRMNTFGFVGDLFKGDGPDLSCVYHSEEAENSYLLGQQNQEGGKGGGKLGARGGGGGGGGGSDKDGGVGALAAAAARAAATGGGGP